MATQQEIIKRFMKALDTHKLNWSDKDFYKKILDDAIEYATSGSSRHSQMTKISLSLSRLL